MNSFLKKSLKIVLLFLSAQTMQGALAIDWYLDQSGEKDQTVKHQLKNQTVKRKLWYYPDSPHEFSLKEVNERVQTLIIESGAIVDLEELGNVEKTHPSLMTLKLKDPCWLNSEAIAKICNMKWIQHLWLANCGVNDQDMLRISQMRLVKLTLEDNNNCTKNRGNTHFLSPVGFENLCQKGPLKQTLESLVLYKEEDITPPIMSEIAHLGALKSLIIIREKINPIALTSEVLAPLVQLRSLEGITLEGFGFPKIVEGEVSSNPKDLDAFWLPNSYKPVGIFFKMPALKSLVLYSLDYNSPDKLQRAFLVNEKKQGNLNKLTSFRNSGRIFEMSFAANNPKEEGNLVVRDLCHSFRVVKTRFLSHKGMGDVDLEELVKLRQSLTAFTVSLDMAINHFENKKSKAAHHKSLSVTSFSSASYGPQTSSVASSSSSSQTSAAAGNSTVYDCDL